MNKLHEISIIYLSGVALSYVLAVGLQNALREKNGITEPNDSVNCALLMFIALGSYIGAISTLLFAAMEECEFKPAIKLK